MRSTAEKIILGISVFAFVLVTLLIGMIGIYAWMSDQSLSSEPHSVVPEDYELEPATISLRKYSPSRVPDIRHCLNGEAEQELWECIHDNPRPPIEMAREDI